MIISTSVLAGIVVAVVLLILITLGSVKLRKISVQKNLRYIQVIQECTVAMNNFCNRNNKIEDSVALDAKEGVVMRGLLKAKLPPALTISSTNLRVLDPIGQGTDH